MSFANTNYTDILATTIESRSGEIADNVTLNNALLTRLKQKGKIKPFSGGSLILEELSFAQNGNAGWYSGYDLLSVAAQDVISAAQFSIKQIACPVVMSGLEMLQNAGKEQIIDLMEGRLSVAEDTMANLLAQGIYSDGTGYGGKQLVGLQAAVVASPSSSGTYGGITGNTWSFWRNQVSTGATSSANIMGKMNALWASLVRGKNRPDLIVTDTADWNLYMQVLQPLQRFTDPTMANAGFVSVKFMDSDVVLDGGLGGYAPANQMYFLNTDYIFLRPHAKKNMVPLSGGRRVSINQDAEVEILAWAGALTTSGRQFQGLLTA